MNFDLGIFLGLFAIAIGVFWGLSNFTSKVSKKVGSAEGSIVQKLSAIEVSLGKIDTRLEDISATVFSGSQTIEVNLRNFGKTLVSADPNSQGTSYIITAEKGEFSDGLIDKLTKDSGFENREIELFGTPTRITTLRPNRIKMEVPSTDPEKCTQYMSMFLKWLDTTYIERQKQEVNKFENGIKI